MRNETLIERPSLPEYLRSLTVKQAGSDATHRAGFAAVQEFETCRRHQSVRYQEWELQMYFDWTYWWPVVRKTMKIEQNHIVQFSSNYFDKMLCNFANHNIIITTMGAFSSSASSSSPSEPVSPGSDWDSKPNPKKYNFDVKHSFSIQNWILAKMKFNVLSSVQIYVFNRPRLLRMPLGLVGAMRRSCCRRNRQACRMGTGQSLNWFNG